MVTHAGLGSIGASLVAETPMVCLPLAREQPINAQAVHRTGTGVSLSTDSSVEDIAAAIAQVAGRVMPDVVVDASMAIATLERLAAD